MFREEVVYSTRRPLGHLSILQDGKNTKRLNPVSLGTETLHSVNAFWKQSQRFIVRKSLKDILSNLTSASTVCHGDECMEGQVN
jgi:hypothetical protein